MKQAKEICLEHNNHLPHCGCEMFVCYGYFTDSNVSYKQYEIYMQNRSGTYELDKYFDVNNTWLWSIPDNAIILRG